MDAARTLSALELDGPSATPAAEVIGLVVSSEHLDPGAAATVAFFRSRLQATFISPALETRSRDELLELWQMRGLSAMRLMDGIFLALHEARCISPATLLVKRLDHTDRVAINDGAEMLETLFDATLAEKLRRSLDLVACAREIFRRQHEVGDDDDLATSFHQGMLIWAIGVHLIFSIVDRVSGLIQDTLPRRDLASDAIEFVGDGARMTGLAASVLVGLEILDESAPSDKLRRLYVNTPFVDFLLRSAIEVRRIFGSDVRFGLAEFAYPDEPGAWELHLVIDSRAAPDVADAALERLHDEWWDEAVAGLGVDIYPVIAAFNHG